MPKPAFTIVARLWRGLSGSFRVAAVMLTYLLMMVSVAAQILVLPQVAGAYPPSFQRASGLGLTNSSPFANDVRQYFTPQAIVDRLGDRIISAGVSNVFNGQPFFTGLDNLGRTFLVTTVMEVAQFGIGELGNGQNGTWEGSLGHILLHGGAGCIAIELLDGNCASGFFAGASQGVLAGSNLTDEQKAELVSIVGSTAGFLWADGQAVGVNFGGVIAQSGFLNNYLTHEEALQRANAEELYRVCLQQGSACSQARRAELQNAIAYFNQLDDVRDLILAQSCQNGASINCIAARADFLAAQRTFFDAAQLYSTAEDYIAALGGNAVFESVYGEGSQYQIIFDQLERGIYNSSGLAWDPNAFGTGLLIGGALGVNGVLAAATLREAARMCGSQPLCTGAIASQLFGVELVTEFSGGYIYLRSSNGTLVRSYDLSPPSISVASITGAIPNPPALMIANRQWGVKMNQHIGDFGLDVQNPLHRQEFRQLVEGIAGTPDIVVRGTFSGGGPDGRRDVLFYVRLNDVVVTSPTGEFVTILRNGVTNPNVIRALNP
jgi:hypothetical protein